MAAKNKEKILEALLGQVESIGQWFREQGRFDLGDMRGAAGGARQWTQAANYLLPPSDRFQTKDDGWVFRAEIIIDEHPRVVDAATNYFAAARQYMEMRLSQEQGHCVDLERQRKTLDRLRQDLMKRIDSIPRIKAEGRPERSDLLKEKQQLLRNIEAVDALLQADHAMTLEEAGVDFGHYIPKQPVKTEPRIRGDAAGDRDNPRLKCNEGILPAFNRTRRELAARMSHDAARGQRQSKAAELIEGRMVNMLMMSGGMSESDAKELVAQIRSDIALSLNYGRGGPQP